MKIDVSDLFDDLCLTAKIAHRTFRPDGAKEDDCEAWDRYCEKLSDAYFIPLVARRVSQLIGDAPMSCASLKRHIITQCRFGPEGVGYNMWYDRPIFTASVSGFYVRFAHSSGRSDHVHILKREEHSLSFHLGPTPELEYEIENGAYDPTQPSSYYIDTSRDSFSRGRWTALYEARGQWRVREIGLEVPMWRQELTVPRWVDTGKHKSISAEFFAKMWDLAGGVT